MNKKSRIKKYIPVIIISILLFIVMFKLFATLYVTSYDIADHNEFVRQILVGNSVNFAHLGYHYIIIFFNKLLCLDLKVISIVLLSLSITVEFVFYYLYFLKHNNKACIALLFSLILIIMNSIYNPFINKISNGQFSSGIYHNPTYLVMRCLGVTSAILFLDILEDKSNNFGRIIIISLVFAYSTFVKPNFSLVFFFVLFLYFIVVCFRKDILKVKKIILVTIPTLMTLIMLYVLTYQKGVDSSIIILPFVVWKNFTIRTLFIPTTIFFSSLFPFVLSLFLWLKTKKIPFELLFSWTIVGTAIILMAFFAESGSRMMHSNFAWSLSASYFIIYAYSLKYLCINKFSMKINFILYGTLSMHLISGIVYIIYLLNGNLAWLF